MKETDYCGIVSGKMTDKAALFDLFYGDLKTAPMIDQYLVCMKCRLERTADFTTHDVFLGEIAATYAQKEVLMADGNIDISKVKPLLFDMSSKKYWSLGKAVGICWNVGKQLKAGRKVIGSHR
jgi:flavin reductase (DIM6/NTAB) family NADH-FMN oxidoreductase RutF